MSAVVVKWVNTHYCCFRIWWDRKSLWVKIAKYEAVRELCRRWRRRNIIFAYRYEQWQCARCCEGCRWARKARWSFCKRTFNRVCTCEIIRVIGVLLLQCWSAAWRRGKKHKRQLLRIRRSNIPSIHPVKSFLFYSELNCVIERVEFH